MSKRSNLEEKYRFRDFERESVPRERSSSGGRDEDLNNLNSLLKLLRNSETGSFPESGRIEGGLRSALANGALEAMKQKVINQDAIIDTIAEALFARASGLTTAQDGPIGAFYVTGPTGCGKTYLCQQFAEHVFGKDRFVRVDCTEFQQEHTARNLFGSPPSYIGYDAHSVVQKIEELEQKGGGVLLFDEIEKAHPDVHQSLLKLLEGSPRH